MAMKKGGGPTVSSSALRGYVMTAIGMGLNRDEVEQRTLLDFAALEDPDGRIPMTVSSSLRELLVEKFGPACSLQILENMTEARPTVVSYLIANSKTLEEAYQQLSRYRRIVTEIESPSLTVEGDVATFGCRYPENLVLSNNEALESFTGFWVIRGRHYTGVEWDPTEVYLQGPVTDTSVYERIFRAPVHNNADKTAIVFPKELLDLPINNPDVNLARYLQPIADEVLKNLPGARSIIHDVQEKLLKNLEQGETSLEAVAEQLHMSARTLQRRLDEESTNFGEVLDQTRHSAAVGFLKDPSISITETAFLLGFSEPSTFYRAFKRWTGETPANYRKQLG